MRRDLAPRRFVMKKYEGRAFGAAPNIRAPLTGFGASVKRNERASGTKPPAREGCLLGF